MRAPNAPRRAAPALSRTIGQVFTYMVLGVGALLILFPLVWALSASFKANREVFTIPVHWIPRALHFENYTTPFRHNAFGRYFFNSLFVAGAVTLISLVVSSLAGFGLAKYQFWGRNVVFLAILSTMMLPVQVILVPLYLVVRDLGWLNTYQGLIIPQSVNAFSIFLMRQHIMAIPDEYLDAARVDGSSELGILCRVVLPMSRPALAAVAIFSFLGSWDLYIWPVVVVTSANLRTLPQGIALFFSEYSSAYNQALAMSIVIMIPVLIVYAVLQRQFIAGLTQTGLK